MNTNPKISICLPNLNNRKFLEERLQTIFNQSFSNWELIVSDNYSDDGAWNLLQMHAKKEPRMYIFQSIRKGMYANWNNCISRAKGEYIYIATSDDTMSPNCLEKMFYALEKHPECDICHCCLETIDADSKHIKNIWENLPAQKFYNNLMYKKHIRNAPIDGILHFAFCTVYTSITQLLVRKKVFDKVGLFSTGLGSMGDFEWGMRASLVCNTLHVPEYLASWRIHKEQATKDSSTVANREQLIKMACEAIAILKTYNISLYHQLHRDLDKLSSIYNQEKLIFSIKDYKFAEKLIFSIKDYKFDRNFRNLISRSIESFFHPVLILKILWHYFLIIRIKHKKIKFMRDYIFSLNLQKNIVEVNN